MLQINRGCSKKYSPKLSLCRLQQKLSRIFIVQSVQSHVLAISAFRQIFVPQGLCFAVLGGVGGDHVISFLAFGFLRPTYRLCVSCTDDESIHKSEREQVFGSRIDGRAQMSYGAIQSAIIGGRLFLRHFAAPQLPHSERNDAAGSLWGRSFGPSP